uniref:Calcium-binding protein SP84 n=1 Tax=Nephotettix cincticeps TaxID=94400 RepID=EFCB_NEPCI|nr:RecName: Full=Calcium-binding protein SP84; AltName: Full=84 kDa salivary protein; Short=NcSP84; Flags: Precursor [Nephotettix cincticeps]BAL41365.1 EF-hand calcium binding protein [Nephotettix cincticeps]
MMRAIYLLVVVCWAAAANASSDTVPAEVQTIVKTPGHQYDLYKKMVATISLPANANTEIHKGLNIKRPDNKVTKADIELYYWHKDLKYAVTKFLHLINDDGNKEELTAEEFSNDLQKLAFKVALVECHYQLSPGLRQACYADEILTYGALVLESDDITKFYKHLDNDKDNELKTEEVLKIQHTHKNKDNKIVAEELGAYSGAKKDTVTPEEFEEYVTQESIVDDFRECRSKKATEGTTDYDNVCLTNELVEYVNDDLTEIDISLLYRSVDTNNDNKIIIDELKAFTGITDDVKAKRILELLDMSATTPANAKPVVDYGEWRTYLRSPTVLLQLERDCAMKHNDQLEEINCMYKLLKNLLIDEHDPIWLEAWDLDHVILFEIFDADKDDGKVFKDDLKKIQKNFHFKTEATVTRYMVEADIDKDSFICLEEFDEYMDIPHMVYGTGECILHSRTKPDERGDCFVEETSDVVDNFKFIENAAFDTWFNHYDTNHNNKIEKEADGLLAKFNNDANVLTMFLEETGQGGLTVEPFEFNWYVKQQHLAHAYEDEKIVTALVQKFTAEQITKLHTELIKYINDEMTERDIEDLFDELDHNDDHELTQQDFPDCWNDVKDLLTHIDALIPEGDEDTTVNYLEFWAWINHPNPKKPQELIKKTFETDCTTKHATQKEEVACYVKTFKTKDKFKTA